ncbi:MAG: alpha/beta fold hydrolase [Anaerolineales bacterium]
MLIPTAEPFLRLGNAPLGVVLIHGFTGAPKEMRGLGEALAARGFSVLGVRLAGHATRMEDMVRMRYTDWMAGVEDGYHLLRGVVPNVALVGLSMGGALALLMATRLEVVAVAALATPFDLPRQAPDGMLRLLAVLHPYLPKSKDGPASGWFDTEAWKEHVAYSHNPARAILELKRLLAEMRAALPQVRVPTLLMHSRQDTYVPPEHMERIYAALGTVNKEKIWLENAGHVITEDRTRTEVYAAVGGFLQRVLATV